MGDDQQSNRSHATEILVRLGQGDQAAAEELLPIVYDELHALARRAMISGSDMTLQTTALLNEAWIRLIESSGRDFDDRGHFLGVASRAMRSILVDRARARGTLKRGSGARVDLDLDATVEQLEDCSTDLVRVDEALASLARADPVLARIVEMRFFGGCNNPSIAEALGISLRSVERGWKSARAWLYARLVHGEEEP